MHPGGSSLPAYRSADASVAEPAARSRDDAVEAARARDGRRFHRAKDQAILEKDEVLTQAGRPFAVFTPYCNAWLARLDDSTSSASAWKITSRRSAEAQREAG